VFVIHAGAVGGYVLFHQPDEIGDANSPLAIDLAPSDDTIDQPEIAPVPEQQQKEVEEPPPPGHRRRSWRRYPSDAQSRGEEGVQLSFTVDRTCHVLGRQIVRSSGHRDRAGAAAPAVSGEHAAAQARSNRADPLFAALTPKGPNCKRALGFSSQASQRLSNGRLRHAGNFCFWKCAFFLP
jgi:hypothetical protein